MKLMLFSTAAILVASPAIAGAPSVFDGTWQFDLNAATVSSTPFTATLKNGTFKCVSCDPPYSVPADGHFHAIVHDPRADQAAITVISPASFRIDLRKNGKPIYSETDVAAPGGKTLTYTSVSEAATTGKQTEETGKQLRVGTVDPAANLASGSWRTVKLASATPAMNRVTFKLVGKTLTSSTANGQHFTATLGGPPVPIEGSRVDVTVAAALHGPRTLVETFRQDGKVMSVNTITVNPGDKIAVFTRKRASDGSVSSVPAKRI